MKKPIIIMLIITLGFMLTGCNFIEKQIKEQKAEGFIKEYYQAIIDEDYEKAFEQLDLHDYDSKNEDVKLIEGTTLSDEEAKKFYLKKIEVLKEKNYKLKGFEIVEVEYEDGHSFWHHIKLEVEQNGDIYERNETASLYAYGGKLLISGDDPYIKYRDGKMNFDIKKEIEKDGI
ncbi:hypothetical protein [Bacillus dakarensis]|uniref:hypothetical protein n=1 Tax=Robertmurraya dakarensis TaxID=1926278 RepID=UPI0009810396|nr:hypothetical protein [Bacillus dakarensis]